MPPTITPVDRQADYPAGGQEHLTNPGHRSPFQRLKSLGAVEVMRCDDIHTEGK